MAASKRRETEAERLDRNLNELFASLRVALPGVQVLFAFLLVLPFQQAFPKVTGFQEKLYFATLMCVTLASFLLIAPTARHRLRFRSDDKAYVVFSSNRVAIAGLVFLGLGMIGAVSLITDVLFGTPMTIIVASLAMITLAWLWFASPLLRGVPEEER
jgi:hypothetical protein